MPRGPIWTIFILMSASIVTAALYHGYDLSRAGGKGLQTSFAWSSSSSSVYAQVENDCSNDKLYFEHEFARLAPIYRELRWRRNQDYPAECVTLGLLNTSRIHPNANSFWCSEKGAVELKSPCVSSTLVNVVDNVIGDVTDCFDLPSREFLAVAAQRALLPLNCLATTSDEIIDSDFLEKSEKISCQRVHSVAQFKFGGPADKSASSCRGLQTPFASLVRLGFSLHRMQNDFDSQWKETDHQVEQLGFDESQRQQLRAWSYFLSAENGVDSAIQMTDHFLKSLGDEQPGRSLSSIKSPGEINLRRDFIVYLKSKLPKEKFAALDRLANWIEVTQPLKGQCVPDVL